MKEFVVEAVSRIKQMETYFDILIEAVSADKEAIEKDNTLQEYYQKLLQYYESPEWKSDYELDEKGLLPQDLKRGILSEDGFWNFLCEIEGRNTDAEIGSVEKSMNFVAFVNDIGIE